MVRRRSSFVPVLAILFFSSSLGCLPNGGEPASSSSSSDPSSSSSGGQGGSPNGIPARNAAASSEPMQELGKGLPGYAECVLAIDPDRREEALTKLSEVAPPLIEPVLVLLNDDNPVNHVEALATLAEMGPDSLAAIPVVIWHTDQALKASPEELSPDYVVGGLKVLVAAAPRSTEVLEYVLEQTRLTNDAGLLAEEYQKLVAKSLEQQIRSGAIDLLSELALECPDHRRSIATRYLQLLADPDYRVQAAWKLPSCRTDAIPALAVLDKLRFDSSEEMRTTAVEVARVIRLIEKYSQKLEEVGIVERDTPRATYELCLGSLGFPGEGASFSSLAFDDSTLFVLTAMCRISHDEEVPMLSAQTDALEAICIGTKLYREQRDAIEKALLSVLTDSDPAWTHAIARSLARIPRTSLPALRAIADDTSDPRQEAAKACLLDFETEIRNSLLEEGSYDGELILALGEFANPQAQTVELLAQYSDCNSASEVDVLASLESLSQFGKSALVVSPKLWEQYEQVLRRSPDAAEDCLSRTKAAREEAFRELGLSSASRWDFWASLISHEDLATEEPSDWEFRYQAFLKLWETDLDKMDSADPRVRAAFLRTAVEGLNQEPMVGKDRTAKIYAIRDARPVAVYLARHFGPEAHEVAHVLADWATAFANNSYSGDGTIEEAIDCLAFIGPDAGRLGQDSLEALNRSELRLCSRGMNSPSAAAEARKANIRQKALAALAVLRGESPVPTWTPEE